MSDVSTEGGPDGLPTDPVDRPGQRIDYELADSIHADDPVRMKALADPLRRAICDLVLERAMTVTELAGRLDRPRGSVAYHVEVLVEAGLLAVVRTRRVRAVEERFYGRVARTFVLDEPTEELPFAAEALAAADLSRGDDVPCGFSLRLARVPAERAAEYRDRLQALALEFSSEPRSGEREFGLYIGLFPVRHRFRPADGAESAGDPDSTMGAPTADGANDGRDGGADGTGSGSAGGTGTGDRG